MKTTTLLLALGLIFGTACSSSKSDDHGHEHGPGADHSHGPDGHSHEEGDHAAQEEFTITSDTTATKPPSIH